MTKEEKEAQDAQAKADKEAADKKKADEDGGDKIDPKLAELMKDPDAVQGLLSAKRAANDEAKKLRLKLEEFEKNKKNADDNLLKEQGKFKELAEKHKGEAEDLKTLLKKQRIDFEVKLEAVVAGIADPADAVMLCDRKAIEVSDDFNVVTGAKEAVEALKAAKPYLFAEPGDKIPPPDIKKASLKTGAPLPEGSAHEDLHRGFAGKKK